MLDASEYKNLKKEYDQQYKERQRPLTTKEILSKIFPTGFYLEGIPKFVKELFHKDPMRFLPNFVDSSQYFTEFFFQEDMQKIYRYFAGEDFLYLGSDGSHFLSTSFPWHRDWYTKIPIMKMNLYFSDYPFFGGRFMLIPGSNIATDSYASLLQKAMSWPMQNKFPGGMNENSFFPFSENPRQNYLSQKLQRLKQIFSKKSACIKIPHVSVKLNKGDAIIFDQRLIHCVEANFPIVPRRLLTILLAKNAYEFSNDHYLIKSGYTREELTKEIIDLVISERNHIKTNAYGKAIFNHPFSKSHHFIKISKVSDASANEEEIFNYGQFKFSDKIQNKHGISDFSSRFDGKKYAVTGKKFRQEMHDATKISLDTSAQGYIYADTHLGINAQNINKISNK